VRAAPNPASKYRVTASSSSPVAGAAVTISAQLADVNGNAVASAGRVVTWTKSNAYGAFAAATSTTNAGGLATVVFTTRTLAGTATTVTATSSGPLTGTSAAITTKAGLASKYRVTSSSAAPVAGAAVTISAQLADVNGNAVASAGRVVTWTKSSAYGAFATATSTTNAGGLATVAFTTRTLAGTATSVTATSSGPLTGTSAAITTKAGALPRLTKLKPASGKRGTTVVISGSGFGAKRGTSFVKFGVKKCAKYVSWSKTRIKCKVPAKAKFGKVSVKVTTIVGKSNAKRFTVKR